MFWGTEYHYSAILMPVVFAAFVDGLVRRPVDVRTLRQLLATSVGVTLLLLPQFALFQLCQPVTWQTPPRVASARAVLRLIPDGATVAASNRLVPQLTRRATVTLFGRPPVGPVPRSRSGPPEWIVVDTGMPTEYPFSGDQQARALVAAVAHGYHQVAIRDGYLLLRAGGPLGRVGGPVPAALFRLASPERCCPDAHPPVGGPDSNRWIAGPHGGVLIQDAQADSKLVFVGTLKAKRHSLAVLT